MWYKAVNLERSCSFSNSNLSASKFADSKFFAICFWFKKLNLFLSKNAPGSSSLAFHAVLYESTTSFIYSFLASFCFWYATGSLILLYTAGSPWKNSFCGPCTIPPIKKPDIKVSKPCPENCSSIAEPTAESNNPVPPANGSSNKPV